MKVYELFKVEPELPSYELNGSEPCLYEIVLEYYEKVFDRFDATRLVQQYIEKLSEASGGDLK